jgi:hypothetical protein
MAAKPDNPNVNLVVVVSGTDAQVRVNGHQQVRHIISEALRESGTASQRVEDWVLTRESDATPLPLDARVEDLGLTDGMRLILNPAAGGGG